MSNKYQTISMPLTEEIKQLRWWLKQIEEARNYWKEQAIESDAKNKQLRSALVEQDFYSFSKAEMWKITADVLATELEQVEQQLWDDKKWIESYSNAAEYWKQRAENIESELRKLFEVIRLYAYVSKHVYRECEDAEILLEQCKEDIGHEAN